MYWNFIYFTQKCKYKSIWLVGSPLLSYQDTIVLYIWTTLCDTMNPHLSRPENTDVEPLLAQCWTQAYIWIKSTALVLYTNVPYYPCTNRRRWPDARLMLACCQQRRSSIRPNPALHTPITSLHFTQGNSIKIEIPCFNRASKSSYIRT